MSDMSAGERSVVIERDFDVPVHKIWRALTDPHLLRDWLMDNDFEPAADHAFTFRAEWGAVDCRVLVIEPSRTLSYSWAAMGLESIVTWSLTPSGTGTRLRMEHSGFRPEQEQAYRGAQYGWQQFLGRLEDVLARP